MVERPAAPADLGGEAHGERPAAGRRGDRPDGILLGGTESVELGGPDGEVLLREPGHLPGCPQPGDPQRRRPARGQHEVQLRRQVHHERLEEVAQRVGLLDIGVVEDHERVHGDRIGGGGAHGGGEHAALGVVVDRVGRQAMREQVVGAGRGHELADELARQRERGPAGRRAGDLDGRCRARERAEHRGLPPAGGRDHERQPMGERDVYPRRRPGIDIPGGGHQARSVRPARMAEDAGGRRQCGGLVTIRLQLCDGGRRALAADRRSLGNGGSLVVSGGHSDRCRADVPCPGRLR